MDALEAFKSEINLTELAASFGYELERRATSRSSAAMRHPDGDKVVIARAKDGHWIYFSVRDDADNGSIIDFVQHRGGGSLGAVRKLLRPWIGGGAPPKRPPVVSYVPTLVPSSPDRASVLGELTRMVTSQ